MELGSDAVAIHKALAKRKQVLPIATLDASLLSLAQVDWSFKYENMGYRYRRNK